MYIIGSQKDSFTPPTDVLALMSDEHSKEHDPEIWRDSLVALLAPVFGFLGLPP